MPRPKRMSQLPKYKGVSRRIRKRAETKLVEDAAAQIGQEASAERPEWVFGYFYGANHEGLSPAQFDFSTATHVIHFQLEPHPNGTLCEKQLCSSQSTNSNACSAELLYLAQQSNVKVLVAIRGDKALRAATSTDASTNNLVANIMAFFTRSRVHNGVSVAYDGIDIVWEPLSQNETQYHGLVTKLRAALDGLDRSPSPLLTTAASTANADTSAVGSVPDVQGLLD